MANTSEKPLKASEYQTILAWYASMGVDQETIETPINWFEDGKTINNSLLSTLSKPTLKSKRQPIQIQPPQSTKQPVTNKPPKYQTAITHTPPSQRAAPLTQPSIEEAKKLAAGCKTLEELHEALKSFQGCGLHRTAKNLVFYRGAKTAPLMIIGEAPGRDEDLVGKPFVGKAGELLDRMLQAINVPSDKTHITNIVYWRPPGNRPPTEEEGLICRPFLHRQIELVKPDVILFLGGSTAKQMYETQTGITKLRGKWHPLTIHQRTIDTMATLHPAYLLRTPIAKRLAWQDLQIIAGKLTNRAN